MIEMWDDEKIHDFRQTLLSWYDEAGRNDLPWRQDHNPYRVWVSEIMLQQTQVNTVIPYFERFMDMFPTVADLAAAPEADILKAWEGLGYYSRVRNMQKAAQQIVNDYAGQWPTTMRTLQKLKGVGPYTAAAIASIAFNEPVAAIDGNAFRVFARLFEIDSDIAAPATRKEFFDLGNQLIDPERPGDFNQAIMDLGSSYMRAKNSDPAHSPVKAFDAAYQDGVTDLYPVKSKAKPAQKMAYAAIYLKSGQQVVWEQRPQDGLLANFWTFPLFKIDDFMNDPDIEWTDAELERALEKRLFQDYGVKAHLEKMPLKPITHVYTHQKWAVTVFAGEMDAPQPLRKGIWRTMQDTVKDPQPKIQEKIWRALD
ncbi:A/G-specific adenine glycosylase [Weissella uvarum]|uniref:A/G-specific adenine glycosylase n=1 Tax=Weissella uvarum TaxID=1479233 RepID=UPI00195F84E5|nr:A/G-specific adenine glycosylase [Weissella uvarum]MBM7616882.1 A/G-specific adenine glycosylase [Weissella uvarum]MCM0594666.1 A/G-specific adenine glycosylase [Weissella uvarum]